jgi:hypothetical protein
MLERSIFNDASRAAPPVEIKTGFTLDPHRLIVIMASLEELRGISPAAFNTFVDLCRNKEHVTSNDHLQLVAGCDLATVTPNGWHAFVAGITENYEVKRNGAYMNTVKIREDVRQVVRSAVRTTKCDLTQAYQMDDPKIDLAATNIRRAEPRSANEL